MNLSERIKAARKKARLTQAELAELVGIAQTAISQLESGKTLRSSYLVQIAQACSVNSVWLASGEGEMLQPEDPMYLSTASLNEIFNGEHEEDARLNLELRERLSALRDASEISPSDSLSAIRIPYLIEMDDPQKPGKTTIEVSVSAALMVNYEVFRRQTVSPEGAVAVAIKGNSMVPVLQDGSSVLVNMKDTVINDGKMYAVDHDGQIRVKTLYRLPGGGVRVRSYNLAEHPDETYSPEDLDRFKIKIIGRVFWGASFF
ncbi:helix-turn-helix transcriptional regulator [Pseudomonas sp. BYT-5]|uniref:XRE family transcriptional regulator n=1 Tax=unclassified Pseudomonas TaxID=196821 RepID=UPI002021F70C|nr:MULTISPECIES: helix-turn-helix transcriptional regulator [unclassified Pseudomonas]URD41468.1 helix-turn-helix transcriptional regulator [Pseudomonas sp. BYT-5]URK96820.1 helix-turn-helix transcriptional regulator [Pseudomonas sp. BYT-1]